MLLAQKTLIWSTVAHLLVLGLAFFMPFPTPKEKPDQSIMVRLVQQLPPSRKRPHQPPKVSPPVVKKASPSVEPVVIPPTPPTKPMKAMPPPAPVKAVKPTPPAKAKKEVVKAVEPTLPVKVQKKPVKAAKPTPSVKAKREPEKQKKREATPKPAPKRRPEPKPQKVKKVAPVKKAVPVKKAAPVKKITAKKPKPRKAVESKETKSDAKKPSWQVDKKPEVLDFSDAIAKLQVNRPTRVEASRADSRAIAVWQGKIQSKIYDNWNKPSGLRNEKNLAVTVLVQVAPDGTLENPRVRRTSGHTAFDYSVLRAIQKTATVERSPKGCRECQELEITFRPEK